MLHAIAIVFFFSLLGHICLPIGFIAFVDLWNILWIRASICIGMSSFSFSSMVTVWHKTYRCWKAKYGHRSCNEIQAEYAPHLNHVQCEKCRIGLHLTVRSSDSMSQASDCSDWTQATSVKAASSTTSVLRSTFDSIPIVMWTGVILNFSSIVTYILAEPLQYTLVVLQNVSVECTSKSVIITSTKVELNDEDIGPDTQLGLNDGAMLTEDSLAMTKGYTRTIKLDRHIDKSKAVLLFTSLYVKAYKFPVLEEEPIKLG